jgi:putative membrane protein
LAFLTDRDRAEIAAAIAAAERRTRGELVAVVAAAADDYRYVALLWPALAALLLPALLLTAAPAIDAWLVYLAQTGLFVLLCLLAQLSRLRLALVPAATKRQRAGRLAREQFVAQGLHLTRERIGVLIFVSIAEHHVEIIADRGIAAVVPDETWGEAVAGFIERVRAGRVADGFLAMIAVIGDRLAEHFPSTAEDRDELPNRLVEI